MRDGFCIFKKGNPEGYFIKFQIVGHLFAKLYLRFTKILTLII